MIENLRKDFHYLGIHYGRLLIDDLYKTDLLHDTKARSYSLSYPLQCRQRNTPPEERPDISIAGHRHVMLYMYYNNEHMFEAGCFCRSSPYMRGRGIQSTLGGWIVRYAGEEKIKKLIPELYTYGY